MLRLLFYCCFFLFRRSTENTKNSLKAFKSKNLTERNQLISASVVVRLFRSFTSIRILFHLFIHI